MFQSLRPLFLQSTGLYEDCQVWATHFALECSQERQWPSVAPSLIKAACIFLWKWSKGASPSFLVTRHDIPLCTLLSQSAPQALSTFRGRSYSGLEDAGQSASGIQSCQLKQPISSAWLYFCIHLCRFEWLLSATAYLLYNRFYPWNIRGIRRSYFPRCCLRTCFTRTRRLSNAADLWVGSKSTLTCHPFCREASLFIIRASHSAPGASPNIHEC